MDPKAKDVAVKVALPEGNYCTSRNGHPELGAVEFATVTGETAHINFYNRTDRMLHAGGSIPADAMDYLACEWAAMRGWTVTKAAK